MRIFAADHDSHAYTRCFYAAVSRLSVEVVPLDYSGSVLIREVRKGDWLHLHWPSWLYYSAERSRNMELGGPASLHGYPAGSPPQGGADRMDGAQSLPT